MSLIFVELNSNQVYLHLINLTRTFARWFLLISNYLKNKKFAEIYLKMNFKSQQ